MLQRNELVRVRASDLEPGQRVRFPRTRRLVVVIDVTAEDDGSCNIDTEDGVFQCRVSSLIDAEDSGEVCP